MASDIRLSVGFFAHPKSLKLERRLGPSAVVALIRLWCWTAQHRPSGVLEGLDAEDLELAVGWIGEPGTLIATLLELRFLDEVEGALCVHGWTESQPWIASSELRHQKAITAARARWGHAPSMPEACFENAPSTLRAMPSTQPNQDPRFPPVSPPAGGAPVPGSELPEKKAKKLSRRASMKIPPKEYPEAFKAVWEAAHPLQRRCGISAAHSAWKLLHDAGALPEQDKLLRALTADRQRWEKECDPRVAHLTRWLTDGRFATGEEIEQQAVEEKHEARAVADRTARDAEEERKRADQAWREDWDKLDEAVRTRWMDHVVNYNPGLAAARERGEVVVVEALARSKWRQHEEGKIAEGRRCGGDALAPSSTPINNEPGVPADQQ